MFPGLLAGAILTMAVPPTADSRTENRKDALAKYGAALWQAKRDRLLSAAKQLEAVARQDADATAPLKELVRIYSQVGRELEAIRIARKVIAKDPADVDTAHLLARMLYDAGEFQEAAVVAKLAADSPTLTDRPDRALAIYRDLATICDAGGDHASAEAALRRALKLFTENRKLVLLTGLYTPREIDFELAETQERLGRILVKERRFDDATTAFQAAHDLFEKLGDTSSAARLNWNLSGTLMARGDPVAALERLERYLKLKPQAVEPFERFATLMHQVGRGGQCVRSLRAYAADDPKNLDLLAILAAELDRNPATRHEAEAIFTRLAETSNEKPHVRVWVRSCSETDQAKLVLDELDHLYKLVADEKADLKKQGFAAEKARVIGAVLRDEPEWCSALFRVAATELRAGVPRTNQTWQLLGLLAARHRKLEYAVLQFREAVRNAPVETETDAYVGLIDALRRLRRPADIAAVCREGLQNSRSTAPVFFNYHLCIALAELGDEDGAIAAADKAILQSGDRARLETRLRKVWVLHTVGRTDEAIALAKKLFEDFHTPAERIRIHHGLAGAYYAAKKYPEWEAELRAVLDIDPDDAGACNDLGYHLADQGRNFDEAELLVRHAIAIDRMERRKAGDAELENASYLDSLGWVLFRQGKLAEARALIERATTLSEGAVSGEIWDHLGDICFRLNDKPAAKLAWKKAEAAYATDARARREGRADEVTRKLKRIP